jgi:hypothetical protein
MGLGYVYIACPPLYKITMGRGGKDLTTDGVKVEKEQYFYDQEALDSFLASLPPDFKNYQLQRFKGTPLSHSSRIDHGVNALLNDRFGRNDAHATLGYDDESSFQKDEACNY